jgi:uncharacterized membrane protein YheB (UPF0754 family)
MEGVVTWKHVVLAVLMGSLIGYVTNWLAIKMLFRPLKEKRIFNRRLPFTPGVFPKEKERLAGSIGDTVGNLLLNEEQVVARLLDSAVEEQVRGFYRGAVERALAESCSVHELLTRLGLPEEELEAALQGAARYLAGVSQDPVFRRRLASSLAGVAGFLLDRRVRDLVFSRGYAEFKEGLEQALHRLLAGESTKQALYSAVDRRLRAAVDSDRPLAELLPPDVLEDLLALVEARGAEFTVALQNYIRSPETRAQVSFRIELFFEENRVKRLLGSVFHWLGADSRTIARRVTGEVVDALADPANQARISREISSWFRDSLNKSPAQWLPAKAGAREETLSRLAGWLAGRLTDPDAATQLLDGMDESLVGQELKTWREVLNVPGGEAGAEQLEELFYRLLGAARGPRLEQVLYRVLRAGTGRCLAIPVKDLAAALIKYGPPALEEDVVRHYRSFVTTRVPGLLGFADVSGMVRRRVNQLEVLQVEEMLLGIMRRELVAITWLGALLGAVIGLAMVGLQYLL